MNLTDCSNELLKTLCESRIILIVPLLITYTEILEVEWFWMTHVSTKFSPLILSRIAISEVDKVDAVIDIWLKFIYSNVYMFFILDIILELTTHTTVKNRKWFCTNLFWKLEELKEAKSVTLEIIWIITTCECIVPTVFVERTILNWTYSILPLVTSLKVCTFYDTTTRETEDTWVQLLESFCKVLTHTVLMSLVSINREERYMFNISSNLWVAPNTKVSTLTSLLRSDSYCILLPFLTAYIDAAITKFLVVSHCCIINDINPNLWTATIWNASPNREAILSITLYTHAEVAFVFNHCVLITMTSRCKTNIMRIFIEWTIILESHITRNSPTSKTIREFERTVLDEFCIETAISRIVDILKEDTVHSRRNLCTQLRSIDVEGVCLSMHTTGNCKCSK